MQPVRELTPQEVEEGKRGINDRDMTATQVQALVKRMDGSKQKWRKLKRQGKTAEYEQKLKEENEILYFNYPSLFTLHAEDRLDETFFEMLRMKRKIEKGELTEDQASKMIGQKLFDHYVAPVVNQAPPPEKPMSYEEYYKQFTQQTPSSTS